MISTDFLQKVSRAKLKQRRDFELSDLCRPERWFGGEPTWWLKVHRGIRRRRLQQSRPAIDHVDPALVLQLLSSSLQRLDEVLVRVGADHPSLQHRGRWLVSGGASRSPQWTRLKHLTRRKAVI